MELKKFYRSSNGIWVVGDYEAISFGRFTEKIKNGNIEIRNLDFPESDNLLVQGPYNQFCNEAGTAYASLAAFKLATDDFFVNASRDGGLTKTYSGLISQVGTAAPTVSLFKNGINAPNWVRITAGTFELIKTGAFVVGKTVPSKQESYVDAVGNLIIIIPTDADRITLKTYSVADITTLSDGVLSNQFIKITVNL